jgi:hypothetical protein
MDERQLEKLMSAAAVRQVQILNDSIPDDNELDKIIPSINFEQNMRKVIAKDEKHKWQLKLRKRVGKIAASFVIVLTISFGVIISVDASRANFIQFFERCFSISSVKNEGWNTDFNTQVVAICHNIYLPSWMPEGFQATEISQGTKESTIIYKSKNQSIRFTQYDISANILNDNQTKEMDKITIQNQIYYFSEKYRSGNITQKLIWQVNQKSFILTSSIGKDDLLRVAQNLELKES